MADKTPMGRFIVFLRSAGLVLVVAWLGFHYWPRAHHHAQDSLFIGNPDTACVYPINEVNATKLAPVGDGSQADNWDEFESLKEAKSSGYRLCP